MALSTANTSEKLQCTHCGEDCTTQTIVSGDAHFCCDGCKMVYEILNEHGLCDYYALNENPGASQRIKVRKDKFAFLEDEEIAAKLVQFKDEQQTHITFYTPQMHCSSCLWLLEHLHRLNKAVISSKVNFPSKEVTIVFQHHETRLRTIAELLTSIGYEPHISLQHLDKKKPRIQRSLIYQVGVSGFCFSNIMLLSFPEYLGLEGHEKDMQGVFRWLNFALSLPVLFYGALPFYESAWKGLKHRFLNIDAPIALAILVTFIRSCVELMEGSGAGYFDSMAGIVFFMLVGRILQDKTYQELSFERDYTAYFPIAVSVLKEGQSIPTPLPNIKTGDTLLIHGEELIPADGIVTRGKAFIDYSFVTGESIPVRKEMGELVYAGGRQTAGNIELLVVKEVTQSYLTSLWSKQSNKSVPADDERSFVHLFSKYFTYGVFTIATLAAGYWAFTEPSKIWPSVTAVLIIACPCALLLCNTFTNGNILRLLGRNKCYLRNAQTIEDIANIDTIVFDKTGTLTTTLEQTVHFEGELLSADQRLWIAALAANSQHPLSRAVYHKEGLSGTVDLKDVNEIAGAGIEGLVNGHWVQLGSATFTGSKAANHTEARVYVSLDRQPIGYYAIHNHYRESLPILVQQLGKEYQLSVISGDNAAEQPRLQALMGPQVQLAFEQRPTDKLAFIQQQQNKGHQVMMVGDGLNDAGALQQANVGIAITESTNNFTPASDAILHAGSLALLPQLIQLCKANKTVVIIAFIMSIVYNIIGLYFAVQGNLNPMVAAILMPCISITTILVSYGGTSLAARLLRVYKPIE